jgi:malate dehydrogenase
MGGMLDSARFKRYLSEALQAPASDIEGLVIGGHGDTTMIPLTRFAAYKGIAASALLTKEALDKVAADTMVGGATLTKMLGTSAWYAPGAAGAMLVEAIIRDQKKMFPCCVLLDGEYGQKDICIGVPVIVGKHGWERIINYDLNADEQAAFNKSAEAVRTMNNVLHEMKLV